MDSFLGEIRMFGFSYAPRGWALCQGQTIPIAQNSALFALLGLQFGGDGRSTFGLPNLQTRLPIGAGQGLGLSSYMPGQTGGVTSVTLNATQLGAHNHALNASTDAGTSLTSNGNVLAQPVTGSLGQAGTSGLMYSSHPATTALSSSSLNSVGGNGPHNNLQPYVVVNYCISLQGAFPMRP